MGGEMYDLIRRLYPICRSITGDGVRETLSIISEQIPLSVHEVPTGTEVFDWVIPDEWNIRDAWVKDPHGNKIIDFRVSNLHVLNYSEPVHKMVQLNELKKHLFTLPEQRDLIPYRTSYHNRNWGFCLPYRQYEQLQEGEYEVLIDSTLEKGSLTYGEYFIQGKSDDEVLLSCHVCHPSLCNDNLSGIAIATYLAKYLASKTLNYSYRFVFIPGTIGSITWLSRNDEMTHRIKHGLVLTLLGDQSGFTYKKSRRGDAEIDRIVENALKYAGTEYRLQDFSPYGYDERQYCSPGFNLPVGNLSRAVHGEFKEYHTSADNLNFVDAGNLAESYRLLLDIIHTVEHNDRFMNLNPKCEPQLGKRGLYSKVGGKSNTVDFQMAVLWVLNYSDGEHSLVDISEKSGYSFELILSAAEALQEAYLLKSLVKK
jgi:aminopeptidase-like protein